MSSNSIKSGIDRRHLYTRIKGCDRELQREGKPASRRRMRRW